MIRTAIACVALIATIALPAVARAEFTVTIRSTVPWDEEINYQGHLCIHDPSNFHKTIPAGKSVQIAAKWIDGCGIDGHPSYIMLYLPDNDDSSSTNCYKVEQKDKYKQLVLRHNGDSELAYLALESGSNIGGYQCNPDASPGT